MTLLVVLATGLAPTGIASRPFVRRSRSVQGQVPIGDPDEDDEGTGDDEDEEEDEEDEEEDEEEPWQVRPVGASAG